MLEENTDGEGGGWGEGGCCKKTEVKGRLLPKSELVACACGLSFPYSPDTLKAYLVCPKYFRYG